MRSDDIIVKVNNISVCYDDYGTGILPVLFIHGFPFNKSMWRLQMDALDKYARLISYDLRSFGKSTNNNEKLSIDLFADDLISLMDTLQVEKAVICGLSMGGYIALNVCERYINRVAALVLCDTQCNADSPDAKQKRYDTINKIETNGLNSFSEEMVKNLLSENDSGSKVELKDIIQSMIRSTPAETVTEALKALAERWDSCITLEKINIPSLIICGKEDKITPVEKSLYLHNNIKGSQMKIIEHAGHLSNMEQPEIFNECLGAFLRELM